MDCQECKDLPPGSFCPKCGNTVPEPEGAAPKGLPTVCHCSLCMWHPQYQEDSLPIPINYFPGEELTSQVGQEVTCLKPEGTAFDFISPDAKLPPFPVTAYGRYGISVTGFVEEGLIFTATCGNERSDE